MTAEHPSDDAPVPVEDLMDDGAARRHEPGVAGGRSSSQRRTPFVLLVGSVVGAGLCALLALNTAAAATEVRERQLDASNSTLTDSVQQLSRDVANRQAPAALAAAAAKLGLVPAGSPAFLKINPDGSSRVLGVPVAVTKPPPDLTAAQVRTKLERAAARRAAKRKAAAKKAALEKAAKVAAAKRAAAKKAANKAAANKADDKAAGGSAAKARTKKTDPKARPVSSPAGAKKTSTTAKTTTRHSADLPGGTR